MRRGVTFLAAATLAGATLASGCSSPADPEAEPSPTYVALGDSFTSGAGLPEPRADNAICGQSDLAYPRLVAVELKAALTDVSCGGASTDNGLQPQDVGIYAARSPQLDAVTPLTDLVTVSLGINDESWYLGVMFGCTSAATADPTGRPCEEGVLRDHPEFLDVPDAIGDHVAALLDEVHRRAPKATVLVVGYPQPVPATGTCPQLPLAAGDYAYVREQWEAVDEAIHEAADAGDAAFIDVMGASAGHDICAGPDAWVNGYVLQDDVAGAYHPFATEQAAVAQLILQGLDED